MAGKSWHPSQESPHAREENRRLSHSEQVFEMTREGKGRANGYKLSPCNAKAE